MGKLSQIGNVLNGKTIPKCEGIYPAYGGNGIICYVNQYNYPENTIIIGRVGAYCGSVYFSPSKCWVTDNALAFTVSNNDPYFVYCLLRMLKLNKFHIGSSQPLITQEIIRNIEFDYIEDKDLQISIGTVIKSIDNKIENNNCICADLEAMAKLLYDYWFVQFDFPDENGKPYKSSGGKMVWNEGLKREIPEGWEVKNITEICDIVDCLHSKKPEYCFEGEPYYLLTLENLTKDGHLDLSEKFYISRIDYEIWTSKIEVCEGDFVVTNAGRAGDIGRIPKGVKCAIGRNFTAIRPKEINSYYLNMFLHSIYMQTQITSNLDQGSFFTSFNVYAIKKLNVLIPDNRVMKFTLKLFCDLEEYSERLIAENQQLASLRDFLLPMLMNGQVKVSPN